MTAAELKRHFNEVFMGEKNVPKTFQVTPETYGNVCDAVFKNPSLQPGIERGTVSVHLGPNQGIMFKGIELILRRE